jgi:hypothetical protein
VINPKPSVAGSRSDKVLIPSLPDRRAFAFVSSARSLVQ